MRLPFKILIAFFVFAIVLFFSPSFVKIIKANLGFDADAPVTTVIVQCKDSSGTQVGTDQTLSSTTTTANCGGASVKATIKFNCVDVGGGLCTTTGFSVNGTPGSTTGPWPYTYPSDLLNTGGNSGTHSITGINSTDDHTNTEASFDVTVVIGYKIQGTVYRNDAHDCVSPTAYTTLTGSNISVTPSGTVSVLSGAYTISGITPGAYNVTLTAPLGFAIFSAGTTCNPSTAGVGGPLNVGQSITISTGDSSNKNFYITPLYQISGTVFNDSDKNGLKAAGENPYSGSVNIATAGGTLGFSSGTYNITRLTWGTYTVEYENSGYEATFPTPTSHTVTLGLPGCSVALGHDASCEINGNIINLNYGITNSTAWWQCVGGDCRRDDISVDKIPSDPDCGSGMTDTYASIPSGVSNSPGIIYFGSGDYDFGAGSASQENWTGGTSSQPFSPVPNIVRTSYSYISATLTQNGITPADIASSCAGGISNCQLSTTISNGVYKSNGNLTLIGTTGTDPSTYSYTFPTGKNYVILVNGDLYINTKILVPVGSTATFYVSGSIYIDHRVGQSDSTVLCNPTTMAGCDMEGFYSTDGSIYTSYTPPNPSPPQPAKTKDVCTGTPANKRLNIAGSIVANAAREGGSIENGRDLCGNNLFCPSYTVTERPDFYLNAPNFIKAKNTVWQEVAP